VTDTAAIMQRQARAASRAPAIATAARVGRACSLVAWLALAIALAACGGGAPRGTVVEIDGLRARVPPTWFEVRPVEPPRVHEFRLAGRREDAELTVLHYGRGFGGDVATNIERWQSQFEPPVGRSMGEATEVRTYRHRGVLLVVVSVRGTYLYRERPLDTTSKPQRRADYRLIGVIVQSHHGPFFIRLVGPAPTVARHEDAFFRWLRSFE
jgi:hypothetical protein